MNFLTAIVGTEGPSGDGMRSDNLFHAGAGHRSERPACLGEGYAELGFRGDGGCTGARAPPVLQEDLLGSVQEALALQRCCSWC